MFVAAVLAHQIIDKVAILLTDMRQHNQPIVCGDTSAVSASHYLIQQIIFDSPLDSTSGSRCNNPSLTRSAAREQPASVVDVCWTG